MPNFLFEKSIKGEVVGIDEVGRGSWAGPVVSCAVLIRGKKIESELFHLIEDSKKLSSISRMNIYKKIIDDRSFVTGVGVSSVDEIDKLNIQEATFLSMKRAFDNLRASNPGDIELVLVDGNKAPKFDCNVKCIIRGDQKSLSISSASIVAKVTRDKIMINLSEKFPGYGWETNMGYGTNKHKEALIKLGINNLHRKTFKPIRSILEK
mgnify:CR=1 FL=1